MTRLAFSREARQDLQEIAFYIARDNPQRALSFVAELESQCVALLDHPASGQSRPELAPGLRSKPFGKYLIFYTPLADRLVVERIIHGARDIGATFANEA